MKKIFYLFLVFIVMIFSAGSAFAEKFYIENYNVKMNVLENNTIQVEEVIDVNFTQPAHGIYRTIPLIYIVERNDGSGQKVNSKIKNLKATDFHSKEYVAYFDRLDLSIKMGNADRFVSGNKTYKLTYDYIIPLDNLKDSDELYLNIIGTQWKTNIRHVNFEINMPKPFNSEYVGFSVGRLGQTGYDYEKLKYSVDGNKITGETKQVLNPHEGITIRVILPDNYFIVKKIESPYRNYVIFGIIFLAFCAFIIWLIYGKDDPVIPIVNFYPPDGKNSAEVGVDYKGKASIKEVVSLIVYLASKGYFTIEESKNSFTLTKKQEYGGKNHAERMLMNSLFANGAVTFKEELEKSPTFYKDCQKIIKVLNKEYKINLFDKNAVTPAKVIVLSVCILGILMLILYSLNNYEPFDLSLLNNSSILLPITFILLALFIVIRTFTSEIENTFFRIIVLIWALGFAGCPIIGFFSESYPQTLSIDSVVLPLGICAIISSIICLVNLPKRNYYGKMSLGKVLGLKKFLEVAEKNRIEQLVLENPNYCYDLVPFAYVLGVSDKWISNFESIIQSPPDWYKGSYRSFNHSFDSFSTSLSSVAVPSVENGGISRSSGGFSGGGYSGGGHCGGGGGSW